MAVPKAASVFRPLIVTGLHIPVVTMDNAGLRRRLEASSQMDGLSAAEDEKTRAKTSAQNVNSGGSADRNWAFSFKVFKPCETEYVKVLSSPSGAAVMNMVLTFCFMVTLVDFAFNYAEGRRITDTIEIYLSLVGHPRQWLVPVIAWTFMMAAYLLIYPLFLVWATLYHLNPKVIGWVFGLLYFAYLMLGIALVTRVTFSYNLSFHMGGVLSCEQIRIIMKSYAFIHENVHKVTNPWKTTDERHKMYKGQLSPELASFDRFLYFSFAPVLLYRDEYPRLQKTDYKRILWHVFEFFASQILALMAGRVFIQPYFSLIPTDPLKYMILTLAMCGVVGPFFTLCAHVMVIHAPYNIGSQVFRFADRGFYEDWWISTSYQMQYRKWHTVIHDWLKYCVLEDLKPFARKNGLFRMLLPVVIIALSGLGHDYAFMMCTKFFVPSLLFLYLIAGSLVYFLTRGKSHSQWNNFFVLSTFSVGMGLCLWPYLIEFYGRTLCPFQISSVMDMFVYRTPCVWSTDR